MGVLVLHNTESQNVTVVANRFIDEYMPGANGEYVKVYLLLLRYFSERKEEITLSFLADVLDHTEKDVVRALRYWEKMNLLLMEYNRQGEIKGIYLQNVAAAESSCAVAVGEEDASICETGEKGQHKEYTRKEISQDIAARKSESADNTVHKVSDNRQQTVQIKKDGKQERKPDLYKLSQDEEFAQLLYLAERYIGMPLTAKDTDVLAYFYDILEFSSELIEYLVEYCVDNGHKSSRYMEKTGLDWNSRGIGTVEQAKEYVSSHNRDTYAVMKAFGLSGRNPAFSEREMIDRWLHVYGFTMDIILEACNRTIRTIHQPSFEYTDKILAAWQKNGVKHKADISIADSRRQEKIKKSQEEAGQKKNNRFHNFEQRDYDCDELLKQINGL